MANNVTASRSSPATVLSGLPAPVPFKDVAIVVIDGGGQQGADAPSPEEQDALPSNPKLFLHRYQGTWVLETWVPGIAAIQRGGLALRRGDVVLASAPMCGAPWLKALAFAAMARGAHSPAAAGGHPLRRMDPDDCVPSMEKMFGTALGRKAMDALPSPRLMATHMRTTRSCRGPSPTTPTARSSTYAGTRRTWWFRCGTSRGGSGRTWNSLSCSRRPARAGA
ncbi:unnamed protein product [Urochloa humidicola]